jgi:hypothetical protein
MRQRAEAELNKRGIALPAELVKPDAATTGATVTQADRDAARQRAPQATAGAVARKATQQAALMAQRQRPKRPTL